MSGKILKHLFSFGHRDDGATAIEFAFFSIPLTFLIVGMVEIALLSTAGTILQGATDEAARLIRTGQAQNSGDPEAAFKDLLCDMVDVFIPCDEIMYEAIRIEDGSFSGGGISTAEIEYDEDGNMETRGFDPGEENEIVVIRTAYRYPLVTPFVGPFLADEDDGKRLLVSTAIVKNEPYEFSDVQ